MPEIIKKYWIVGILLFITLVFAQDKPVGPLLNKLFNGRVLNPPFLNIRS